MVLGPLGEISSFVAAYGARQQPVVEAGAPAFAGRAPAGSCNKRESELSPRVVALEVSGCGSQHGNCGDELACHRVLKAHACCCHIPRQSVLATRCTLIESAAEM